MVKRVNAAFQSLSGSVRLRYEKCLQVWVHDQEVEPAFGAAGDGSQREKLKIVKQTTEPGNSFNGERPTCMAR
jgi:hypothetical protein